MDCYIVNNREELETFTVTDKEESKNHQSIIVDFIHVLTLVSGTKTNVNTKHRRRLTEIDRNMLVRPYSETRK